MQNLYRVYRALNPYNNVQHRKYLHKITIWMDKSKQKKQKNAIINQTDRSTRRTKSLTNGCHPQAFRHDSDQ